MQESTSVQPMLQVKRTSADCPVRYKYLISTPPTYNEDSTTKWPLIIFLHGSGECGTDTELVKKHGIPRLVQVYDDWKNGKSKPGDIIGGKEPENKDNENEDPSVIGPQPINLESAKFVAENFITLTLQAENDDENWWEQLSIRMLIDEVESGYRVDPERIYLTGCSMGGYGTIKLATEFPEKFAAAVPICGWEEQGKIDMLRDTPTWLFHGEKDDVVSPQESRKVYKGVMKVGGEVKITMYPEAKHDSWTETYNNIEVYQWLLEHKKRVN